MQSNKEHPKTTARFSSTMRIDLTADVEEATEAGAQALQQSTASQSHENHTGGMPGGPHFHALFESVYDAAIITNLDGEMICANSRAEEFFEIPAKQFKGTQITDLISGSNESLMPTIYSSLQHDRFILIQAYCYRSDGSVFAAEVSANMLTLSKQQYISFFIRDVTFRKEAEKKLRTGHTAIQNSGSGIAVSDIDGNLEYYNPAMAKLLGIQDDGNKIPITQYLCNQSIANTIHTAIQNGQAWSGELQMLCTDETSLAVLASVAPNHDADEEVVGMVWSLLDISDQKRIQNELRQHNAQLADDLNLANEFQLAFIQREYPTFPAGSTEAESAIELGHAYLPSGAVGGDFFEIFSVSLSRVGIFISDVMGHGVRSALIVATIRGLIEELGPFRYDPAAFLSHMNRDLTRIVSHPGQMMFASAFYMVVDLTDGSMTWASAGHPPPLLVKNKGESIAPLQASNADTEQAEPAMGLFPNTEYHAHTGKIEPNDMLLMYTDGIAEVEDEKEENIFDVTGLIQTLDESGAASVAQCLRNIVSDAQSFAGNAHFDDDVCLIGMRLRRLLPKTTVI